MKVGELKAILNRYDDRTTVMVEAGEEVIHLGDAEKYPDNTDAILIRTAGVGFIYQSFVCGTKMIGRNAYDYDAKRFCCKNCGMETKGKTYMRKNLLCKRCCVWLNMEWEG